MPGKLANVRTLAVHHTHEPVPATLRDLIEAVGEQVQPGNDRLVAAVVSHMLDSGQVRLERPTRPMAA